MDNVTISACGNDSFILKHSQDSDTGVLCSLILPTHYQIFRLGYPFPAILMPDFPINFESFVIRLKEITEIISLSKPCIDLYFGIKNFRACFLHCPL